MKVLLLSAFVVTFLLAFIGQELLGSSTGQGQDAFSGDSGLDFCENFYCPPKKPQGKKPQGKKPGGKKPQGKKPGGKKPQGKKPTIAEQRKKAEEQRKKEEAARQKKLQADQKKRNAARFNNVKATMAEKMSSLTKLTWRIEAIDGNRKKLNKAIKLVTSKATGENIPGMMDRLKRMETQAETYAGTASVLTNDLNKLKTTCAKWSKSGGKSVPSVSALAKMEEDTLSIKRDFARVEFELNKAEAFFKNSTQALFSCVATLVDAQVRFSAEEKDTVRAIDRPE